MVMSQENIKTYFCSVLFQTKWGELKHLPGTKYVFLSTSMRNENIVVPYESSELREIFLLRISY